MTMRLSGLFHWWSTNNKHLTRDQLDFLPSALAIQKRPPSSTARWLLWSIVALVISGVLWLSISQVDIIVDASGQIITNARLKLIQPYQKGNVEQLLVADGDHVKQGQLLVVLDTDITRSNVESLQQQITKTESDITRHQYLLALFENIATPQPSTTHSSDALGNAAWQSHLANQRALESAIEEKKAMLAANSIQIDSLQKTLPFITERSQKAKGLLAKDFISKNEYQRLEQERIIQAHQLQTLHKNNQQLQASIKENQQRLSFYQADFKHQQLNTIKELVAQKDVLTKELIKAESLNGKQLIRSPADGVVQELAIHTVGGVVTEAQPLMKIVPIDAPLEVLAYIENSDIGFIELEQEVTVKVNAFPFTEYGTITGRIIDISDAAIPNKDGNWQYSARIAIEKSYLPVHGKKALLRPGMNIMAEVKTGNRRLLQYFLSPIMKTVDESFEER